MFLNGISAISQWRFFNTLEKDCFWYTTEFEQKPQKNIAQCWTWNWEYQILWFTERVNGKWTTYITLTGIYLSNLFLLIYKQKASGFYPVKALCKLKGVWSGWGGHNWGHWTHSKLCHWNFPGLVGCQMVVGETQGRESRKTFWKASTILGNGYEVPPKEEYEFITHAHTELPYNEVHRISEVNHQRQPKWITFLTTDRRRRTRVDFIHWVEWYFHPLYSGPGMSHHSSHIPSLTWQHPVI